MSQDLSRCALDVTQPALSRVLDVVLAGDVDTAVDRVWSQRVEQVVPALRYLLSADQAFVARAARSAVDPVEQVLVLSSGRPLHMPLADAVCRAARDRRGPAVRPLYVDTEACAVAMARLVHGDDAVAVHADIGDVQQVRVLTRGLLDWLRPLLVVWGGGIDELRQGERDSAPVLERYVSSMNVGSRMVFSCLCSEVSAEWRTQIQGLFGVLRHDDMAALRLRTLREIDELLPPAGALRGFGFVDDLVHGHSVSTIDGAGGRPAVDAACMAFVGVEVEVVRRGRRLQRAHVVRRSQHTAVCCAATRRRSMSDGVRPGDTGRGRTTG